jgi:8-oxo-dGTP diphosphatase
VDPGVLDRLPGMNTPASWQKTNLLQHTYCSYCGTAYPEGLAWPRTCVNCEEITWSNPIPVAVALLPVRLADGATGLVVVRRDIEPARGELALPGGFIETGESWQEATVRELREETGLTGDPDQVSLVDVHSTPGISLLIFGRLPVVDAADLPASAPTEEATEWLVITEPQRLAFPTHSVVVTDFFTAR